MDGPVRRRVNFSDQKLLAAAPLNLTIPYGQLAALTNLTHPEQERRGVMIKVVAEEGFEPPTRGL
jgi:hypothetical protein